VDIELASVHEAGHAVAQWLVGWELKGLHMTVVGQDATNVYAECPSPPDLDTISAVRKQLLVLFAGNASTRKRWPDSFNDWKDWLDSNTAIRMHLHRDIEWYVTDGMKLRDPEANELVQAARVRSEELVRDPKIRAAIDEIAREFASASSDAVGRVWLPGATAVGLCEKIVGKGFQAENPWSAWLAGE
jgi:hypothetical protein